MSPDPGGPSSSSTCTTVTPDSPVLLSPTPAASRRQRSVGTEPLNEADHHHQPPTVPPPPSSESPHSPGTPPTLSSLSGALVLSGSSSGNGTGTSIQPNPRRHRQRLANHYLHQIRAAQQQQQTTSASSVTADSSSVIAASQSASASCHRSSSTCASAHQHHYQPPPPFHQHYYHPYQQQQPPPQPLQHTSSSASMAASTTTHHHLHHFPSAASYPSAHGFYSSRGALPRIASFTRHHRSSQGRPLGGQTTERSPFLMVKILLFTLMTIDFVMNTIGLAVIAVMAKNHFNNLAVERSLHPPAPLPPLEREPPPPDDPYRQVYNHPGGNAFFGGASSLAGGGGGGANEWTILLPLLPSFIFVEILTLVGMFGVFCDLFSFTMTYAILKLITSLCYPSMASTAAVAAMASSSGSVVGVSGGGAGHSLGIASMAPGFSSSGGHHHHQQQQATNIAPSLLPLPLPENFTAFLNQAKLYSLNNKSFNFTPTTTTENSLFSFVIDSTTTTVPPTSWAPPPVWSSASSSSSTIPPSHQAPSLSSLEELASQSSRVSSTTTTPTSVLSYKHTRLKHDKLMAQLKAMKKTEKMAKLKQREKQLRSKLLRLESASAESNASGGGGWNNLATSLDGQAAARIALLASPSNPHILDVHPPAAAAASANNSSTGGAFTGAHSHHSGHHSGGASGNSSFKYHHRVWEALLCTFQVIFAVAFAFNTLTINARRHLEGRGGVCAGGGSSGAAGDYYYGSDYDDAGGLEDGLRSFRLPHRSRSAARRYRSQQQHCGRAAGGYPWPYSPLATSIDAFYFAQYQLPPPPPPYFGASTSSVSGGSASRHSPAGGDHVEIQSSPRGSGGVRHSPSTASSVRPVLEPTCSISRWSRLTPSWLRNATTASSAASSPSARRLQQQSSAGAVRSPPSPPPPLSRTPSIRSMPPLYEEIHRDDQVVVVGFAETTTTVAEESSTSNSGSSAPRSSVSAESAPERILLQVITTAEIEHHHHHHHLHQPTLAAPASSRGGRRAARRLATSSEQSILSLPSSGNSTELNEEQHNSQVTSNSVSLPEHTAKCTADAAAESELKNITTIKVPETTTTRTMTTALADEADIDSKTLVITVNENDTRV